MGTQAIVEAKSQDPATRGYFLSYHYGEVNYCPGCGHAHWYIGRRTAECAFCETVIPLPDPVSFATTHVRRGKAA